MQIKVSNKRIGKGCPVFIIAEGGVNHNGSLKVAKQLVDAAVKAGADAVKFQNFDADSLIRKNAPKAKYQDRNIGTKKSQYQMLKELELSYESTLKLKDYCDKKGIIFFSTPYDFPSLELLEKIHVPMYKLASIDIVFHPLIKKVAMTGKPLILSTGMATEQEVVDAVAVFKSEAGSVNHLVLLQCNTNYPSRPEDQNLLAMHTLNKYVPVVGYSDHTEGSELSIAATALGAKVIERHFTLDKSMPGPDHKASMDTTEFRKFVEKVRNVEAALGTVEKKPTGGELENITSMRRSICAKKDLPIGTKIREIDLAYKRPGDGLFPTKDNICKLISKKNAVFISADENITLDKLI